MISSSPFSCIDIISSNPNFIPSMTTRTKLPSSPSVGAAAASASRLTFPLGKRCCSTSSRRRRSGSSRMTVSCEVALRSSDSAAISAVGEDESEAEFESKIGAKIRVKVPLQVYHVSRVADELDLQGMEGTIKQYVGLWKGIRISANLPYKVEFVVPDSKRGGNVKFFAHLREDEFEFIDS